MTKKLVFMRTHIIEQYVFIEFLKLKYSMNWGDECILFIDNTNNIVESASDNPISTIYFNNIPIKCFLYKEQILEKSGLPKYSSDYQNNSTGNILWYNGDYPFYIIKQYFPNFDYYWCTEYDVYCNSKSYKPFFKQFQKDKSDLISSHYRKIDPNNIEWCWSDYSNWIYDINEHYRSFFPVIRLSAKALNFLKQRRIEHGKIFEQYESDRNCRWIFCELFVPTELVKNNYTCTLMDKEFLRYEPNYNLNKERFFEFPDGKLYHPVR